MLLGRSPGNALAPLADEPAGGLIGEADGSWLYGTAHLGFGGAAFGVLAALAFAGVFVAFAGLFFTALGALGVAAFFVGAICK